MAVGISRKCGIFSHTRLHSAEQASNKGMPRTPEITKRLWLNWMPPEGRLDDQLKCQTVRGLALRVRKNSTGVWLREAYLRYTWRRKTRVRLLGQVGVAAGWTLEAAREKVFEYRSMIRQAELEGKPDPLFELRRRQVEAAEVAQASRKVEDLAADYLRLHSAKKAPALRRVDESRWKRIEAFQPPGRLRPLGVLAVEEVTTRDLVELHISMGQTPTEANRFLSLLSHAFGQAAKWGYLTEDRLARWRNPVQDVERYPESQRDRPFQRREIAAILLALNTLIDDALRIDREYHRFLRLRSLLGIRILVRTGFRPAELLGLTAESVFWDAGVADLEKAKGDRKVRRGRLLAFGRRALADLRQVDEMRGGEVHLFLGTGGGRPMSRWGFRNSWADCKARADELFGTTLSQDSGADLYTLRHTFVSAHEQAGVDFAQMVELVGHAKGGATTFRYRHTSAPRLVEAAQLVEDYLEGILEAEILARSPQPTSV